MGLPGLANVTVPTALPEMTNIKYITSGQKYTIAVDGYGSIWMYGTLSMNEDKPTRQPPFVLQDFTIGDSMHNVIATSHVKSARNT
jgi:alpha-tubulin suppressor-like RCC1 family protein